MGVLVDRTNYALAKPLSVVYMYMQNGGPNDWRVFESMAMLLSTTLAQSPDWRQSGEILWNPLSLDELHAFLTTGCGRSICVARTAFAKAGTTVSASCHYLAVVSTSLAILLLSISMHELCMLPPAICGLHLHVHVHVLTCNSCPSPAFQSSNSAVGYFPDLTLLQVRSG